jgi:nucleoside-diphosphate-sugar epimerase
MELGRVDGWVSRALTWQGEANVRALVTGGAGFIGSHLVRRLLATGHEVRVVDNLATGRLSNLDEVIGDIEFFELDIRDVDGLRAPVSGCDTVIHVAALPSVPRSIADPAASHEVNATGTLNVLTAARAANVARVITASSSSIYGAARDLPKREDMRPLPISPYAVSKLAAESYCRSFYEVYRLETVALRYFNVFGPRQDPNSEYAAVIPRFIRAFAHGESPTIFGDGEQSRDFTYVENVVNANMAAIEASDVGGRVYNIACGHGTTLNEIARRLREEVGAEVAIEYGAERQGDVRHSMADISAARADLGYEPAVTLEDGIHRTVGYYHDQELELQRSVAVRRKEPVGAPKPVRITPISREKRYVITGGAGFIGSHLTEALVDHDERARIVILDDLSTGSFENVRHLVDGDRVSFVRGSVTDAAVVDELMRDAHQCIHLASAVGVQMIVNEPLDTLMKSVRGSNVVMHAATRNSVRVLFSSTSEVYGKQSHKVLGEQDDLIFGSPSKGRWTYAIAKSFGEALIHGYHRQRGVNATIVRLFNCVGPRQTATYGMVLPRFVRQALAGEDLTVYGDGTQTRCFTHVRDTVGALLALCDSDDASGRTFNVGTGNLISIHELARRVIARSGSASGITMIPYDQAYSSGFEELGTRIPDTSALEGLTGWQARFTINDAIDDVINYERAVALYLEQLGVEGTAADAA